MSARKQQTIGKSRLRQDKSAQPPTIQTPSGFSREREKELLWAREICPHVDRAKTVSKLLALEPLGLASSEKQVPQIVENTKKCGELLEPLEPDGMRPRQVRYQAALRPDFLCHSF
jgi:hypothetical protein